MKGTRTQKIPAWSANITANGPKDMAQALGRQAFELGISTGELLRQLWIAGARVKFPKLAAQLIASHRKYYPHRQIIASAVLLLTLGLGQAGQMVVKHRHAHDARGRGFTAMVRAKVKHQGDWQGVRI